MNHYNQNSYEIGAELLNGDYKNNSDYYVKGCK